MNEWMDGWMDGWREGGMDVWMDGWMDGWIENFIYPRWFCQNYNSIFNLHKSRAIFENSVLKSIDRLYK